MSSGPTSSVSLSSLQESLPAAVVEAQAIGFPGEGLAMPPFAVQPDLPSQTFNILSTPQPDLASDLYPSKNVDIEVLPERGMGRSTQKDVGKQGRASGRLFYHIGELKVRSPWYSRLLAPTVDSVAFSPDGAAIASGSRDGSVRIWDVATLCGNLRI